MTYNRKRADELLEIVGKATPGPWHLHVMGKAFVGNGVKGNLKAIVHVSSDQLDDLTAAARLRVLSDAEAIATLPDLAQCLRDAMAEVAALQAKIDALMLEHCSDEMTPEQKANWAKHQKRVIYPSTWFTAEGEEQ